MNAYFLDAFFFDKFRKFILIITRKFKEKGCEYDEELVLKAVENYLQP